MSDDEQGATGGNGVENNEGGTGKGAIPKRPGTTVGFSDSDNEEANKFIRRLRNLKGQVTRQSNRWYAEPNPNKAFLEVMFERTQQFFERYNENCDALIDMDLLPAAAADLELCIEDLQQKVRQKLNDITRISSTPRTTTPAVSDANRSALPKLPDLPMPRFSGQRKEWLSYRKYISEMIEPRQDLSDTHKFHYLNNSLSGSAKSAIASSGSTFVTAWSNLKEEYDNQQSLKEEILGLLWDIKTPEVRNADSLTAFIDSVQSNLKQLETLGVRIEDIFLTFHLKRRLDIESLTEFHKQRTLDTDITWTELMAFLKRRVKLLTTTVRAGSPPKDFNPAATSTPKDKRSSGSQGKSPKGGKSYQAQSQLCFLCENPHPLYQCWKAKRMPATELKKLVAQHNLCTNCLRSGHSTLAQCTSTRSCLVCRQSGHHTLLHDAFVTPSSNTTATTQGSPPQSSTAPSSTATSVSTSATTTASTAAMTPASQTTGKQSHHTAAMAMNGIQRKGVAVLATAIIHIKNRKGLLVPCRAFLDSGSDAHFITTEMAAQLQLPRVRCHNIIDGINGTETINTQKISAEVHSLHGDYSVEIDLLLTRRITGDLPQQELSVSDLPFPLADLADPAFNTPGRIDVLLGSDVFYAVLDGRKTQLQKDLFAYPSLLGVIIAGRTTPTTRFSTYVGIDALRRQVQKFWEVDSLQNGTHHSIEERATEQHFVQYVKRRDDGHYEVALPFKPNLHLLGNTAARAKAFFLASEKKLIQHPEKYQHYKDFMQEMLTLGHMKLCTDPGYFMTHHIIKRPSSTTTQHRVVFNASFKSNSGLSLNDTLMVGPTIQDDIICHLLRWREHKVATTADLEKMYRMVYVRSEDQHYQQIWWRDDLTKPLLSYALTTVTYGTASAPFQATRCLKQLAEDEHLNYSDIVWALTKLFYMDDCSASFNNSCIALKFKQRTTEVLSRGGFNCRKWQSNDPALNDSEVDPNSATVLGVKWNKLDDTIVSSFSDLKLHHDITKCSVLSETAQLFDPLGLAAPIVLLAKLFIQRLWSDNLDWTETLPSNLAEDWKDIRNAILEMTPIQVSRPLLLNADLPFTMHGFADASITAYGACIYFVSEGRSMLAATKSRVAPIKTMTIPRLELSAALLLAQLIDKVRSACQSKPKEIVCWTDSQITYHRIQNVSSRYTTFVAVRVAEIQQLTQQSEWRFIPGEINPADIVSRGMLPTDLNDCSKWWHGPEFLQTDEPWPEWILKANILEDKELKKEVHLGIPNDSTKVADVVVSLADSRSSIKTIVNVVVYIVRFYINLLKPKATKYHVRGELNLQEREDALLRCYRSIQQHYFTSDYNRLSNGKRLKKSSNLLALRPYLDEDGLMRVGGRLTSTELDSNRQVLLPNCKFSKLILEDNHWKNHHAGPQALLAFSRQSVWILGGLSLCRDIVHHCMTCFRNKPKLLGQIMSDLHPERYRPESAFEVVGIDYTGPFTYKPLARSKVLGKAYIMLVTCYKYRCIHLEVVHDLTTESFMNALRRFVGRRGVPRKIYSDNATNLTGGRRELSELRELLLSQSTTDAVKEYCNDNKIQWTTIPARSPHFGGTWEAEVKQFKHYFYRSLSDTYMKIDELQTLVIGIEAVLNSRPLTPSSSSVEDFKALTPGHFLILKPLNLLPEPSWRSDNIHRLKNWQQIQYILCTLADRFKQLYFHQLQRRSKWQIPQANISAGTMVLLQDDNLPPTKWKLGRIVETYKGADGMVRSVSIQTSNSMMTRAVHRVAPLPID